jgi:hypothetical protein
MPTGIAISQNNAITTARPSKIPVYSCLFKDIQIPFILVDRYSASAHYLIAKPTNDKALPPRDRYSMPEGAFDVAPRLSILRRL